MKRPRGKGGRFLKKEELPAYYAAHPEEDPDNPMNQPQLNDPDNEDMNDAQDMQSESSSDLNKKPKHSK